MKSLIAITILFLGIDVCRAQVAAQFINQSGQELYIWFLPRIDGKWKNPPLHLYDGQLKVENFQSTGRHLVVLQGLNNKWEASLGDWDLHDVLKKMGNHPISIQVTSFIETRTSLIQVTRSKQETRTREVPVTTMQQQTQTRSMSVHRMRPEKRTRTVCVFDHTIGKYVNSEQTYTVMVPYQETVEQTYTVCVPVTQTRTETYVVNVPYVEDVEQSANVRVFRGRMFAVIDGKLIPLERFVEKPE